MHKRESAEPLCLHTLMDSVCFNGTKEYHSFKASRPEKDVIHACMNEVKVSGNSYLLHLLLLQNIDSAIGFWIPNKLKAKIKLAMEQGVTKVFGAVTNNKLFNDRNYNVYLRPGDRAMAAASGTGGSMSPSAEEFEDSEAGFYDANSQNGSFMSATEVSPFSQFSMLCAL
jgi:hypothetical protein